MRQSDYNALLNQIEQERQVELLRQQMASPYYLSQQQRGVQIAQTRIESIERTTDNVYVNVVIDHADGTNNVGRGGLNGPTTFQTNDDAIPADYTVTKTEPILDRCSDYYCSIIRFTIPLDETPLLICPIVANQIALLGSSNPNLTPLIFGIQNGPDALPASYFSANVLFTPDNNFPPPIQNQPLQVITPYYYIFQYQIIVDMFNNTLATVYANSGLAALNPGYLPPYFEFNPTTSLFSLIVPSFMTSAFPFPSIKIFFNEAVASFLFSFNIFGVFPREAFHQFGFDYYFILTQANSFQFYPPGVTVPATTVPPALPATSFYYKYTQEYSVLEYWTSLKKILIFSNAIPIKNEFAPATNNMVPPQNIDQAGINVSYPILTDFVPNVTFIAGESRSIAYYVPTTQYRLIDMISTGSLQKIDVKIFWEDRDGNLYPLEISLFQQANFKIGFFKKTLYNGSGSLLK
jgi:hypothetical protein